MGSSQSLPVSDNEDSEESDDEDDPITADADGRPVAQNDTTMLKKVLEQEPEMLPCHASASPLSPQLSSLGTPRLGPSIKVWDPYNVLCPPSHHVSAFDVDRIPVAASLEVFLVAQGETDATLRPGFLGSFYSAGLNANGKRQARALAVLLNSQGVRFDKVYCSPLDRTRSMAASVCQGMNFPEDQIQSSDALSEMSFGQWEGSLRSDIYTQEVSSLMDCMQSDFAAPSGESLRQVEFRMIQFINGTVLGLQEKLRPDMAAHNQNELPVSPYDRDEQSLPPPPWDMLHRHRQGIARKKSGKSRLQLVTATSNHEGEDEISPHDGPGVRSSSTAISSCVGIFSHATPIKCLLTGLLGCSSVMSRKICIEDSSVTVIQHSWITGWQIKKMNDTSHLRLL